MRSTRDRGLDLFPRYSYRGDARVPPFAEDKPLIVFDGVCVLCSGFARFVAKRDPSGHFRFTAAQSTLGQALYRHYGLDPFEPETILLLAAGRSYGRTEAFTRIMARLRSPWRFCRLASGLPRRLCDWVYDRIARNRYGLFGRRTACIIPDASWQERVIE
jgi:predicted DCC family thiol-disulfide oxidoreductase YuxK